MWAWRREEEIQEKRDPYSSAEALHAVSPSCPMHAMGMICLIDAGPCHWRVFLEEEGKAIVGSLSCMKRQKLEGAGRQKLEEAEGRSWRELKDGS